MSEPVADVVRAKRFELVDSGGTVRATLAFEQDGNPAVSLCDREGNVRAELCITSQGVPELRMRTESGGVRAAVGFGTSWTPGFVLTDRDGVVLWSARGQS